MGEILANGVARSAPFFTMRSSPPLRRTNRRFDPSGAHAMAVVRPRPELLTSVLSEKPVSCGVPASAAIAKKKKIEAKTERKSQEERVFMGGAKRCRTA